MLTLAEARVKALSNRRALEQGEDPRAKPKTIPTFAEAAEKVIAIHCEGWKADRVIGQWRSSLDTYAMPTLGSKFISDVTSSDVMAVLTPIWISKRETARKLRQRIGAVMKWAVAEGHREDNPAGDAISAALPKPGHRVTHHQALPHADVGTALVTVRETAAYPSTKLAFEFLTLTACRSGEVRLAEWSEIEEESLTWTIPASRMKNGLSHRVPLSVQAMDVLRDARELNGGKGMIFPSVKGKAMTDSTMSKLVRENGIECVPHGMRSSFRDWAAECSDAPREVCELALAHVEGSAAELAYRRTDLFERRRELMQSWADYVVPELPNTIM